MSKFALPLTARGPYHSAALPVKGKCKGNPLFDTGVGIGDDTGLTLLNRQPGGG